MLSLKECPMLLISCILADKYKALNVTHQMHKVFIDSFLKALVSVVGKPIVLFLALMSSFQMPLS